MYFIPKKNVFYSQKKCIFIFSKLTTNSILGLKGFINEINFMNI